jgi:AcrR family transcriptional regulator
MTARPSGLPNAWIATAFNVVSVLRGSIGTLADAPVRLAKVRAVTDRLPHTLRSDARDNRELILAAARAVLAAEGLNVPMREIARRAGVGPATLYRRFPTKEMLVTAAFTDEMRACHDIVGKAWPTPIRGTGSAS